MTCFTQIQISVFYRNGATHHIYKISVVASKDEGRGQLISCDTDHMDYKAK